MKIFTPSHRRHRRAGFTILELMIAAAATLLIMAALTRAFQLIGVRVRDSRAAVTLSGDARDINFRLRTELGGVTASPNPNAPEDGVGYLMYYEGPLSESTTATVYGFDQTGAAPGNLADGYLPLSRWGDNDDYLAFTAKAGEGESFSGIVPLGVLEAVRAANLGGAYVAPTPYDPLEPVAIKSQYAEIVYWVAPRIDPVTPFATDNGDNSDGMNEDGMPNYLDRDTNGLPTGTANAFPDGYPDELVLYRRTLLIRPDLNLSLNDIPAGLQGTINTSIASQKVLCFRNAGGTIDSANNLTDAAAVPFGPGAWGATITANQPNWLVGMAGVQQIMDLSVARDFVLGANGVSTGFPNIVYSANNLEQLRDPHRRFGHVMMPGGLAIHPAAPLAAGAGCSMPLLALSPPSRFLTTAAGGTPQTTTRLTVGGGSAIANNFTMLGYLRPEFVLQGTREGEDIIATNIVSFDVQAYDPGAPVFLTVGSDLAPGRVGIDDDANGFIDTDATGDIDVRELGAVLSDDQVVTPSDPYIYYCVRDATLAVGRPSSKGAFVDLGYFFQPGGNIRGVGDWDGSGTYRWLEYGGLCANAFSGLRYTRPNPTGVPPIANPGLFEVWRGLRRSGKCLLRSNGQYFIQPTFDSWTRSYETDGINQVNFDLTPLPTVADFNGMNAGTLYWAFNPATAGVAPFPAPTITTVTPNDVTDPISTSTVFVDGSLPIETVPPIDAPLAAIRVTVENYDVTTRQIIRSEIIHDFVR